MQSASHSALLDNEYIPSRRERVTEKAREWMGGGRLGALALVLLLTLAIAKSTATVGWVEGIDVIVSVAIIAAVLMAALAVLPLREPIALGLGLVLAPVAALLAAWPEIHKQHRDDVLGLQLVGTWWNRVTDGSVTSDPSFYLVLICLLMWISGGWLAWCVLRWRKSMLGLIPGAAAFATNVLNLPDNQNGYTLAILIFTLALLLWTNYTGSIANAVRAKIKLSGDARWDFWESGLVAMAALIVLGIMLPPLSTADRTLDVESGIFTSWAQLQQQLNHPGFTNGRGVGSGVTGFSSDVTLSGPLTRTKDIAFTYTIVGEYASGARYFRGLDETVTFQGEWRYSNGFKGLKVTIPKNEPVHLEESYQKLAAAGFNIHMQRPPIGNSDLLFYPGQFYKVDRPSQASQVPLTGLTEGYFYSVDRLGSLQPASSVGNYSVTVEYSTATAADLQAAGTNYPDWVGQFDSVPPGYRPDYAETDIHQLALKIVNAAGATTPYDKAVAIETYLRDPKNFTYTLTPPKPTAGEDPLWYFLFQSHKGYCEFFASAMGDMLRSLGIPTRLVNGFGPGQYDSQANAFVVRGSDAHTWVEVYFPAPDGSTQPYGWIPFEPTADGTYNPIGRGSSGGNLCLRDNGCDPGSVESLPGAVTTPKGPRLGGPDIGGGSSGGGLRVGPLDASSLTTMVAVAVALILLLLVAISRYLRPRTVMAVWKRMLTLARLAGEWRPPGETPLEIGRRLQRTFPEAAQSVDTLTSGFVVAAYAPPEVAATSRESVMEAWSALRPALLRRILRRLSPTRP